MNINLHHLELFRHVAEQGGITAAARAMPYGIQQPAISAQLLALENNLGCTLFRRRPFELTAEGRELASILSPFFREVEAWAAARIGAPPRVRIAAGDLLLRTYLPSLLSSLRAEFRGLEIELRSGSSSELEEWIRSGQVDIAVGPSSPRPGTKARVLLKLKPAFLVPAKSEWKQPAQILAALRSGTPWIALPPHEPLSQIFQHALSRRGIEATPAIRLDSLDLVIRYVQDGFGIGMGVPAPGIPPNPDVRWVPIPGCPALKICVLTGTAIPEAAKRLLQRMAETARELQETAQKLT